MDWNHNIILKNRRLLSKFLEKFSLDQLNTVPKGYRNSIFWNVAHTVVTQQLLVYGLSNRPLLVDSDLVKTYKKDTKTVHEATEEELALVKTLLFSTIEQTKTRSFDCKQEYKLILTTFRYWNNLAPNTQRYLFVFE